MKTTFRIKCLETGEQTETPSVQAARIWAGHCRKVHELWGARTTFILTRITEQDEPLNMDYMCPDCGEDYAEHRRGDFGGIECQIAETSAERTE